MRRVEAILVAAMAFSLAGCVLGRKPKPVTAAPAPPQPVAAAPAPQPLSIPQTHVDLPAPQPVDPAALATAPPVEPPAPVQARPAPVPVRRQPAPQPKADPSPPEPSPARQPIQEVLPAEVQKQLQASAQRHKAEIRTLLAQAQRRSLTAAERSTVARVNQFVKLSDDAEKSGDMRSADELAERAHILARELQSGH
jgi:hypothetical protein